MRSSVLLALFSWSAGTVVSGSTSTASTGSSCPAQDILDNCLALLQPRLTACPANDWDCLCTQSNDVLTCYNNCPNDQGAFGAQQTKISYCNAASVYLSSTSTVVVSTNSALHASGTSNISSYPGARSTSSPSSSSGSSFSSAAATPSASSVRNSEGAASGLVIGLASLLAAMIVGVGAAM